MAVTETAAPLQWPGQRLGRPQSGPGSVASLGARLGAFVVDALVSDLLALLWGFRPGQRGGGYGLATYVVFLAMELVFVSIVGQTLGMRLLRLRVERIDGGRQVPWWVAVRTLLLALVVPAVVIDRDGRGLHDRAAGVVLVRTR